MDYTDHRCEIFIGYSRKDGKGFPSLFYRELTKEPRGNLAFMRGRSDLVFMDDNVLLPGDDWPTWLKEKSSACKVFIAVIGPRWCKTLLDRKSATNGCDNLSTTDWVLQELEYAFKRPEPAKLFCVFVDGATPNDIQPNRLFEPGEVRSAFENIRFQSLAYTSCQDIDKFIEAVRAMLQHSSSAQSTANALTLSEIHRSMAKSHVGGHIDRTTRAHTALPALRFRYIPNDKKGFYLTQNCVVHPKNNKRYYDTTETAKIEPGLRPSICIPTKSDIVWAFSHPADSQNSAKTFGLMNFGADAHFWVKNEHGLIVVDTNGQVVSSNTAMILLKYG